MKRETATGERLGKGGNFYIIQETNCSSSVYLFQDIDCSAIQATPQTSFAMHSNLFEHHLKKYRSEPQVDGNYLCFAAAIKLAKPLLFHSEGDIY